MHSLPAFLVFCQCKRGVGVSYILSEKSRRDEIKRGDEELQNRKGKNRVLQPGDEALSLTNRDG